MEKFNEDDGVWRTINGRRVFIRDGESVESAMSRSGKFKSMSRVEKNKDKYDKINKFKERKQSNLKVKYHKTDTGVEVDEEDRKRIMKELGYDNDKLSKDFEKIDSNKYEMKKEEREKVFKKLGLRNDNEDIEEPTPIRKDEQDAKRRAKLMRYTQENKEKIAQYGRDFDEETEKEAFEKTQRNEGLKAKEYFGYIGRNEKPGDIISDVTADGEDVIVAKDGNWVRKSRINEYNKNPKANQNAVVDIAEEERKIEDNNYAKLLNEKIDNYKNASFEEKEKYRKELNDFQTNHLMEKERKRIKEKINRFKEQKQSNKLNNEKSTYDNNYNKIMNWEKESNNYNIKARASIGGYGETTFVFSKQDNNRKDLKHYKITLDNLGKLSEKEINDVLLNVEKKLK